MQVRFGCENVMARLIGRFYGLANEVEWVALARSSTYNSQLLARLSGDMNRIEGFPPPAIRVGHLASAEWDKSAAGGYPRPILSAPAGVTS